MKKTIALVLALVMVFALCACGAQTPETGDNAGTTSGCRAGTQSDQVGTRY